MPQTLLTDVAEAKLAAAAGSAAAVSITHIALGDGGGSNYAPTYDQTGLVNEIVRKPIEAHHMVDPNAWRVKAEFGPETQAFGVREIGFFDEVGDLVCIWAGLDVVARQTGSVAYLVDHVLSFSRVEDGLVVVNAPDDLLFALAVGHARSMFLIFKEQMRQGLAIEALQ
ncbi:phage tail protein [Thalassovita aquimarina]|uniref:Phage tail protein n=1 Tax=Thalassovita aquimarina TaxID=2785917 RepID=A0ABS5HTJ5_9RHOB|nr:phage tail protein [Thalassovita aquimarina]MBR9651918.1 phage tail protein [Thalassovita aquimarina]